MAWNKKSIELTSKPTPFPYFKWCLAICLSILFLIYSLSLKNKDEVIQQKEFFNIIIYIIPFLITIITLLYKYVIYIKNKKIIIFYIMKKNLQIKNGKIGEDVVFVLSIALFFFHKK